MASTPASIPASRIMAGLARRNHRPGFDERVWRLAACLKTAIKAMAMILMDAMMTIQEKAAVKARS